MSILRKSRILCIALVIAIIATIIAPIGTFTVSATEIEGYYTYTISDGKATITDVDTSISGDITIPSTLGGYPVTSIGDGAFDSCSNLTSVTIGDSVTSIGSWAFYKCSSLKSITIGDSVTSIGDFAFEYCSNLTSVTIPDSVTSIGDHAFFNCNSLTSVTIGDSVTSIGSYAFYDCSSLTSVTIGDSVTSIGGHAFFNCNSLTSITIPDSVISIGEYAFEFANLRCVWYTGSVSDKANISVSSYNDTLNSATWFYDYKYCEDKHYVDSYYFENSATYPFELTNGVYSSTNKVNGAWATATFTILKDGQIRILFTTSTEENGDWFGIRHEKYNSSVVMSRSGEVPWSCRVWDVAVGDKICIFYNKNGSVSSGDDEVKFIVDDVSCGEHVTCNACGVVVEEVLGHNYIINGGYTCAYCMHSLTPDKPVVENKTHNSITLGYTEGFEYSNDSINWQDSNVFTDIAPNTTHTFYQRVKASDLALESEISDGLTVAFKSVQTSVPSAPIILSFTDTTVTLMAVEDCEYSCDGVNWQSSNVFTGLNPGTEYTFYQRYAENDEFEPSDKSTGMSITTDKSKQTLIPSAPTVESVTSHSITINKVDGCEYSMDGKTWQSSNVFDNLDYATEYTFYQRYAETDTTYVGKKSAALTTRTDKGTQTYVPSAPIHSSKTFDSVTLLEAEGCEYSIDGVNWQKSTVFTGLEPGTTYTFYQRYAETDTLKPSSASECIIVTTDKAVQTLVPDAPTVKSVTSSMVVLNAVDGCEYSIDGVIWQSSNVFDNLDYATEYTFYQRYAETSTTLAGQSSTAIVVKTDKGSQSAPNAPTLSGKSYDTVILNAIDGYEYSKDTINWQSSNVFMGLESETNYMFYQRKAETDTCYASNTSSFLIVRTEEAPEPTFEIKSVSSEVIDDKVIFTVITTSDFNRVKVTTADNLSSHIAYTNNYTINSNGDYVFTLSVPAVVGVTKYAFDGRRVDTKMYAKNYYYSTVEVEEQTPTIINVSHEFSDDKIIFTVVTKSGNFSRIKVTTADNLGGSLGVGSKYTINSDGNYVWTIKATEPTENTTYAFDLRNGTTGKYLKEYFYSDVEPATPTIISATHSFSDGKIIFTVVTKSGDFNRIKVTTADNLGSSLGVASTYIVNAEGNYVWTIKAAEPNENTTYAFDLRNGTTGKYLKEYFNYEVEAATPSIISVTHRVSGDKIIFTVVTKPGNYSRIKVTTADNLKGSLGIAKDYTIDENGNYVWDIRSNAIPTETTKYAFDLCSAETTKYIKDYGYYDCVIENTIKSVTCEESEDKLVFTVVTKAGDYNRLRCGTSESIVDNIANTNTYMVNADGDYVWTITIAKPTESTALYFDLRSSSTGKFIKAFYVYDYTATESEPVVVSPTNIRDRKYGCYEPGGEMELDVGKCPTVHCDYLRIDLNAKRCFYGDVVLVSSKYLGERETSDSDFFYEGEIYYNVAGSGDGTDKISVSDNSIVITWYSGEVIELEVLSNDTLRVVSSTFTVFSAGDILV
ncbi:MAG: leucine-rich repeat domain-containing protein [Clostridia bacterium]|nr:leucine-rich repeat domain-containing protein [Clostridia bacterium]